jgi:two-component system OmpR family sensor kinase
LSLRSRLLLASVALVAVGLIAADVATYGFLRSSLIGRVDRQVKGQADHLYDELTGGFGGFGHGPGGGGPQGDSGGSISYTALLDSSGSVVAHRDYGYTSTPAPKLPSGLPGSQSYRGKATTASFTTGSSGGGGGHYRILAVALNGGGTFVAASPLGDSVDAPLRGLLLVEGIATASVLAAVVALALWLVRLGLRPLTQIELAAADIAAGDLSRRVETAGERTEVGRLGRALNVMMERIEAAFAERRASEDRLRRFIADASHELRTPLTSIRGYAELFRRGADVRPEDLEKSMRRIEDESTRMSKLVDELLLLARLDQGRPLDVGPVDLAALASDAVADAQTVAPDRPIRLERDGPIAVQGDDARLRQVAANLLSNALEHTPPGTAVRVRVASNDGEAILEVADEGPGLSPRHAAKVFDRFFRVDAARSRDNGGAGLGLSIVAAIVHAHGGRVSVQTAPGAGARFTVALPLSRS